MPSNTNSDSNVEDAKTVSNKAAVNDTTHKSMENIGEGRGSDLAEQGDNDVGERQHQLRPWWRRKKTMIYGSIVTIVVVAIVLIAVLVPGAGNNNTSTASSNAPVGSEEQWRPGTFGPEYDELLEKIKPLLPINERSIPVSKLQEDALLWLTYEDTLPDKDTLPAEQLLERFVLALLYNATIGSTWLKPDQWLTPTSICEWGSDVAAGDQGNDVRMICDESTGQLQTFIVSTKISSMQGAIPTELGLLTQLQEIAISNSDYLTGSIPRDLKNIKGLIRLILESNALSGRIPSEITTFNRLTLLNLAMNDFTGTIPSNMENLLNIESLWLNDNDLTGTIPSELSMLDGLYELWLQNNNFVGTVPASIYEDLTMAYSIRVEGNDLDECPQNQQFVICD